MKRFFVCFLTVLAVVSSFIGSSFTSFAKEEEEGSGISYDQVASEEEKASAQQVGVEGMAPVYGSDVVDGTYEVEVEVSSSMFPVDKAVLTVREGEMTAVLTMGGKGYLKLFMGTGKEAAASSPDSYLDFEEDADGKHTYTIPVEALDEPIDCSAFSKNKEKWYDRQILFRAESLPEEAVLVELPDYEALEQAAKEKRIAAMRAESQEESQDEGETDQQEEPVQPSLIEMEDGEYAIEVELTGGTGRTTVNSPAGLIVKDGYAYARLEWSSSSYDYMVVGGQKYLPVSEEGYSTFEIPITVFNEPMEVLADTTAMSTPHEIEYTLIFHSDGVMSKHATPQAAAQRMVYMVLIIMAVCAIVSFISKKRRNSVK